MDVWKQWPEDLKHYLRETYGFPTSISSLSGIKPQGGCYRVKFQGYSVIVKRMAQAQEYLFYTEGACLLEDFKKNLPALYWSFQDENSYWLVLEDVPAPLSEDRWHADPQVLATLFHFHTLCWGKSLFMKDHYIPKWNNSLTERVLELFPDKTAGKLRMLFLTVQKDAEQLFKPDCWISADPNPTNWGVRKDGTVVLFDWERITTGSPAIDLAITIPGVGTADNSLETLIANRYLTMGAERSFGFPFSERDLVRRIKLAKLWSVVEFLGNNSASLDLDIFRELVTKLPAKFAELV